MLIETFANVTGRERGERIFAWRDILEDEVAVRRGKGLRVVGVVGVCDGEFGMGDRSIGGGVDDDAGDAVGGRLLGGGG